MAEFVQSGAWNPEKVAAFKDAFYRFLKHVHINSKETGGKYCLADGVYEAQRRFLDGIFDGLSKDIHDFKTLKSRQLGVTTISRALSIFWLGVHDGLQGAMIFDTSANTENARREIEDMIDNLPRSAGFPKIKTRNRYGIILDNQSKIQFMSAGVKATKSSGVLGRSSGLNFVHCSEMCSWQNTEGITSLKQSLAETYPNRLYIWESTGRGFNAWSDMWDEARADDLNQQAIFIGWWAKDTQKIPKGTAAFEHYGSAPPTDEELKKIQEVKDRYGWLVTPEQLAWYRRKMDPANQKEEGDAGDGYTGQEQPWTEEECFLATGSQFFPQDRLTEMMVSVREERFRGYQYIFGSDFINTEIKPARYVKDVKLKVWQEPVEDAVYVVAADPAFGHDENNDRSAATVLRCYADQVEQVAEYACASTSAHQFAWVIASLLGWYASPGRSNSLLILEINGPGEAVLIEYKNLKQLVSNGYLRKAAAEKGLLDMFTNVRNYIYGRVDSMGTGSAWHFKTTTQLKVAIMERLRDFTTNGGIIIRSMDTLQEMRSVTRDGDSIKAEGAKHDDRVMAIAMGVRAWEEKSRRQLVSQGRTRQSEIAKRQMSIQDQYSLFTKNTLDAFFSMKMKQRQGAQRAAVRSSWRGKR